MTMNNLNKYDFPEEVLSKEKIAEYADKKPSELYFEILKVKYDKTNLKLIITIKLNFPLSKYTKEIYRKWLIDNLNGIDNIELIEIFDKNSLESETGNNGSIMKRPGKIIIGKIINGEPIEYENAVNLIGKKR